MSRLRFNNQADPNGTVNPITLALNTPSCSWSVAPGFPTIAAPDIAVITVEPNSANEEIIAITAYTAGATSATVTRNFEATTGGANAQPAHTAKGWVHGPTIRDFVSNATLRSLMRANVR